MVSGDSMTLDYHDGEKLYVRKTERIWYGKIGMFTIRNECSLKEYGKAGHQEPQVRRHPLCWEGCGESRRMTFQNISMISWGGMHNECIKTGKALYY